MEGGGERGREGVEGEGVEGDMWRCTAGLRDERSICTYSRLKGINFNCCKMSPSEGFLCSLCIRLPCRTGLACHDHHLRWYATCVCLTSVCVHPVSLTRYLYSAGTACLHKIAPGFQHIVGVQHLPAHLTSVMDVVAILFQDMEVAVLLAVSSTESHSDLLYLWVCFAKTDHHRAQGEMLQPR